MSSLVYPMRIVDGQLATTEDEGEAIGYAILSALMTKQLERALRPYYGREIDLWNTRASLPTIATSVKRSIDTGLIGYPKTQFRSRVSLNEDGRLVITVIYQPSDNDSELTITTVL